ncbi:DUF7305 domain-containing protein [Pseudoalteromonas luteoviolacea]|uniref:DUF7305 domain-containing protein n=1 Tax=Pseudoalteromonas luteoviolacea S4060-1 TaxID=1365257 RepID=A0A162BA50_9GAMM|nr:polymer-forming cytoskeletal protein [Pseudoalteromonas luteoviolacea]KZN68939.1 hypothetical protein N478_13530 [Pseudoalteromonas luteoviolacea S4060-1]
MTSSVRQSGFTLVKVMLLSTMASVVVFTSMKDTLVQERLSGNFQKDLNSRLQAEKGVFASADDLNDYVNANTGATADQLLLAKPGLNHGTHADGQYATQHSKVTNADGTVSIEVASLGQKYGLDAANNMVAMFKYTEAVYEPIFKNAVTGCKGVNLSGSGLVDSYDSRNGTYEQTKSSNGDVNTVIGDADVVLSGHSPIEGDVKASGILYLKGSSPVIGDVQSNTGIDISHGGGLRVKGNVLTQGFVIHRGGDISGVVRANGNVEMLWGADILNEQKEALDIQYGGTGKFEVATEHSQDGIYYSAEKFNVNPNVEAVRVYDPNSPDYDPENPDKECDPLALPANMPNVIDENNNYSDFKVGAQQVFDFTPHVGEFTQGQGKKLNSTETNIYLFDINKQNHGRTNNEGTEYAFGMKNVNIGSDGVVNIDGGINGGDVIWLIDGDFTMGGNSRLNIKDKSSLTIFVTGKVNLGASAQVVTEKPGITKSGWGTFSIFSSYRADPNDPSQRNKPGVKVSGTSSLYAVIYAPMTSISMTGSGQFFGTVRGATIEAHGGSGVHFDEALKDLKIGSGGTVKTPAKLVFDGWRYKHPEAFSDTDNEGAGDTQ